MGGTFDPNVTRVRICVMDEIVCRWIVSRIVHCWSGAEGAEHADSRFFGICCSNILAAGKNESSCGCWFHRHWSLSKWCWAPHLSRSPTHRRPVTAPRLTPQWLFLCGCCVPDRAEPASILNWPLFSTEQEQSCLITERLWPKPHCPCVV